eukprot:Skav219120  [mRNA]  locus=scaffold1574:455504:457528:+ [translate_table: standard]
MATGGSSQLQVLHLPMARPADIPSARHYKDLWVIVGEWHDTLDTAWGRHDPQYMDSPGGDTFLMIAEANFHKPSFEAEEQQRRASFQKHQEVSDSYAHLGEEEIVQELCAQSRKGLRSFLARHQSLSVKQVGGASVEGRLGGLTDEIK